MTDKEVLDVHALRLRVTGRPLSPAEIEQVLKPLEGAEKPMQVLVRDAEKPVYSPIRMGAGDWTSPKAVAYLLDRGFTPGTDWIWTHSTRRFTERDWSAMGFLALREWTFSGKRS